MILECSIHGLEIVEGCINCKLVKAYAHLIKYKISINGDRKIA